MRKIDLAKMVVNDTHVNVTTAEEIIDSIFSNIKRVMLDGGHVSIRCFGTFEMKYCRAKKGQNLKTGKTIEIPERNKPSFRPSKMFTEQ